jgi:hypothetical protein
MRVSLKERRVDMSMNTVFFEHTLFHRFFRNFKGRFCFLSVYSSVCRRGGDMYVIIIYVSSAVENKEYQFFRIFYFVSGFQITLNSKLTKTSCRRAPAAP